MDTRSGEIFRLDDETMSDRKRRRMADAEDRGELVPVSERVAELMESALAAERKAEARAKARKAAKQSRKRNR